MVDRPIAGMVGIACVLWAGVAGAAVTNFPFAESFEHGGALPPGWASLPAAGTDAWTATTGGIDAPDGDHTTGSGYFVHADGWDHSTNHSILTLPEMDLSGVTNPTISYWFAIGDEDGSGKLSYLYLEAYRTGLWVQVGSSATWSPHGWREAVADLAAFRSAQTRLRFRAVVPEDAWSMECVCVDDVTVYAATNPPPAPALLAPAHGATNVPVFATLRWERRAAVDGYRLYAGTDGDGVSVPTNLFDGVALSGGAGRCPLDDLAPDTTYYWKLVPYNANGTNPTTAIRRFRTGARTTHAAFPVTENFQHAGAAPPGWIDRYDDDGTGWFYSDFYADHTSGSGYYADIDVEYQNPITPLTNHLVSPRFDVSATTYPKLSFWYNKGVANNYLDLLVFRHGAWHSNRLWQSTGSTAGWTNLVVDLTAHKASDLRVAFRGIERGWWNGDLKLGLDDITLYDDTEPPAATTPVSPANQATGVLSRGELRWQPAPRADHYILYFGTDGGGAARPTNLVAGLPLGNTTRRAFAHLAHATPHYWQVVPANLIGQATGCPVWRFTTMAAPPALPFEDGLDTDLSAWVASASPDGTLTVSAEDRHGGAGAVRATANAGLYTLAVSTLTRTFAAAADPQLAFWYRVQPGSFAELSVDVFDGQWSNDVWSGEADAWTEAIVDLRRFDTEGGEFMVRFNLTASYVNFSGVEVQNVYLDDVRLLAAGDPPLAPHTPVPADGATNVPVTAMLQWARGLFADASSVYCSTDGAAVSNALPSALAVGATTNTLVAPGFLLAPGAGYCWRIVSTNAFGASTGPVWRFTAAAPAVQAVPYAQTFPAGIPAAFEVTTNAWSAVRWSAGAQSGIEGPPDGGVVMEGGGEDVVFWQPGDPAQIWAYAEQDGINRRSTARLVLHLMSTGGPHRLQFDRRLLRGTYERDTNLRVDVHTGTGWRQVGPDVFASPANTNWARSVLDLGVLPPGPFAVRFWTSVKGDESADEGVRLDNLRVEVPPAAPSPPYGPSPADGEPAAFVDAPLAWNNGAGTTGVDLYFGASSSLVASLDASVRVLAGVATNAFDPADPPRGAVRHWRVLEHGAGGTMTTGPVWSFTVQPEPLKAVPYATDFGTNPWAHAWTQAGEQGAGGSWALGGEAGAGGAAPEMVCTFGSGTGVVRLVSPPLATTGTPWLAVGFRHRLDLDESPGYGPLFLIIQTSADASQWTDEIVRQPRGDEGPTNLQFTLSRNLGATTYVAFALSGDLLALDRWAIDDAVFSNALSAPPPQPAYAPSPADGARTAPPGAHLAWSNAPGTATVDVYLHTNEALVAALDPAARRLANQAAASYDPGGLAQGRTHRWRVVAHDAGGQSATGAVWSFRVRSTALKPALYRTDFSADAWDEAWTQQAANCSAVWGPWSAGPMRAGGLAPEMIVGGDDATGAVARLVSPPIDTREAVALVAGFRSAVGWFFLPPTNAEIAVQSSANGVDWTDEAVWNAADAAPPDVLVRGNMGATTWLAWTVRGGLGLLDYWAIDDVTIYEPVLLTLTPLAGAGRIAWDAVTGATGYVVQISEDLVGGVWSNATATTDSAWTNPAPAGTSIFRVRAGLRFDDP